MIIFIAGSGSDEKKEATIEARRYTQSQISLGQKVFKKNCSRCHGEKAEKTKNLKELLPGKSYPPPPLNGAAHAWHHPMEVLRRTIDNGGIPFGGKMSAFKDKFTEKEKLAAIAYF